MNILLLYPKFPDTFWSFKHVLKFIRKKASLPPRGLLTVAAMLPAPWAKRVVDLNVRRLRRKDLAWADLVCISGMIAQRDSARELIARCRAAGRTIVAGGPLFTLEHEQFPEVDHFVLNEAEDTLPEFLRDIAQGGARRVYASAGFPDLRRTPAPMWELADMRRDASMRAQFSPRLSMESLMAFVRANLRLGFLGRERVHYWRLLLWTLRRRPSRLTLAVTLCIYGRRFRKICKVLET